MIALRPMDHHPLLRSRRMIQKPYLILSRPIQSLAESYNHFNGYVSNIKMKLGDCSGFTKVDMVHLEAIPCMAEEKAEIESLLKSGVLIN